MSPGSTLGLQCGERRGHGEWVPWKKVLQTLIIHHKTIWLKLENKFFFGVITRPASQGPESSPGKIIMVLTTNATTATTMLTLNEGSVQRWGRARRGRRREEGDQQWGNLRQHRHHHLHPRLHHLQQHLHLQAAHIEEKLSCPPLQSPAISHFLLFQILQMSTIVLFYKIYFICFNFGKVKDNWDIEPWTLRAPWQRVDIPTWEGRGGAWGWRSGWWRARRASRGWPSAWTSRNEPSLLSFFCFGQNFIFLSLRNAHVQTLIDRFKITHKSIPVWTWEICQYENSDVLGQLISMKAN